MQLDDSGDLYITPTGGSTAFGDGLAGDSVIDLFASTTRVWTFGLDDSDDDNFKLATSSDFSTGTILEVTTSGTITLWYSGGTDFTNFSVDTNGDLIITPSGGDTLFGDGLAGDSVIDLYASATRTWTFGLDDSDSDSFKISTSSDFASGNALTITTTGNVGIGTNTPDSVLAVASNGTDDYLNLTNLVDGDILTVDSSGDITFSNAFTFPQADGGANEILKTDGSGNLTWQADNAGALGDSDYGDITVSGSGTVMAINTDTIAVAEFLASQDWGDMSTDASGNVTLDTGVVDTTAIADDTITRADIADASQTEMKSFAIETPTVDDDGLVHIKFASAVTITRITCSTDVGSIGIQFDERAEATPNTGGTDVLSSILVCDTNNEASTGFGNAGIAADAILNLDIDTAPEGTAGVARFHIDFTTDD